MVRTFYTEALSEKEFSTLQTAFENCVPEPALAYLRKQKQKLKYQQGVLSVLLMRYILHNYYSIPLSEMGLRYGERGKPYLLDHPVFFNLSHSGNIVTGAFSPKEIGVDIEKEREISLDLARRFYSAKEVELLEKRSEAMQHKYFFEIWTLKESYIKFTGKGLFQRLNSFSIYKHNGEIFVDDLHHSFPDIHFYQPAYFPGYQYAICSTENDLAEEIIRIDPYDFLKFC